MLESVSEEQYSARLRPRQSSDGPTPCATLRFNTIGAASPDGAFGRAVLQLMNNSGDAIVAKLGPAGSGSAAKTTGSVLKIPTSIFKECESLKRSYDLLARVTQALGNEIEGEPLDDSTARYHQVRVRLYALNGIGERLELLLRLADKGNARLQAVMVRQLIEFVALAAYRAALKPERKGQDTWVFVQRSNPSGDPVKTYGSKFVASGLSDLVDSEQVGAEWRTAVDTIYGATSNHTHPSAHEFFCFASDRGGGRLAEAAGIETYAHLVSSVLTLLCFKLNEEYDLNVVKDGDMLEHFKKWGNVEFRPGPVAT